MNSQMTQHASMLEAGRKLHWPILSTLSTATPIDVQFSGFDQNIQVTFQTTPGNQSSYTDGSLRPLMDILDDFPKAQELLLDQRHQKISIQVGSFSLTSNGNCVHDCVDASCFADAMVLPASLSDNRHTSCPLPPERWLDRSNFHTASCLDVYHIPTVRSHPHPVTIH